MPINFELNFVQPLLLDIQNGNIPDADTFSAKVAEYYERTILQGMPQGIPPTLPAPALSGAPGPISSGIDSYIRPASLNSSAKMYRNIARYYVNRELILGEQDTQSSIDSLEAIIRKQSFNIKRIEVFVNQAKQIGSQLAEIPTKAQSLKLLAQDIIAEYKQLLTSVKEEINSEGFGERVQQAAGESAPNLFKEELAIIDTIANLKFDSIQNVVRAVGVIADYNKKLTRVVNSPKEQQKKLVTARISVALKRIAEAAGAFAEPTSFGPLLARLTSDKAEVQSRIDQAKRTYLEIKQMEETLRPALIELERRIAEEKKNLEILIKNKIKDIKERISEKQAANAERRLQKQATQPPKIPKPSPLIDLFEQKKQDIKTFRKNNEENIKKLRRKQQIVTKIISDSSNLIRAAYALQDTIINTEVPIIAAKLNEATGSLQDTFGEGGRLDQALTEASASVAANEGRVVGSIITPIDPGYQLKRFATTSEEKFIRRYFKEQGLTAIADPFVLIATQSKKSFQDFRVFVEQTDKKYDQYAETILSFKPRVKSIIDEIKKLDDEKIFIEPADMDSQSRNERYRAHLEKQLEREELREARAAAKATDAALRDLGLEPKPKYTIIALLKELVEFIQFIYGWVVKTVKRIKKFIKRQVDNAIRIKKQIEEAVIASLPIPTASADIETRAQAAKEKAETIKQYKQKVLNFRKKGEAIALVGQAAGPLLNNLAGGKLRASENEKWIKQIGLGKFKYNIVGLESDSPQYLKEEAEKKAFDENVNSLRIIETYVDLIITVYKDIQQSKDKAKALVNETTNTATQFGLGFIEDLKQAAIQAANSKIERRPDGTIGAVADLASNRVLSVLLNLFEGEPKFDTILSKLRKIRTELKGKVLSSLIQSADFTQSFVSVEQKYLFGTQAVVRKLVGRIDPTEIEKEESGENEGNAIVKTDAEIRRRAKQQAEAAKAQLRKLNIRGFNFYDEMIKLDKLINKRQGSFLAALIDRLLYSVNDFEQRIRKQVKEWLKDTKLEIKERIQKAAEEHSDKLAKIKAKLINADALVQTAVLGLSARMFWTGVTWQNTVGTTFQVITIGRFPRLTSNGLTDGGAAVIREIASNFEKQLKNMQGIYFPNPSLGIPPQTFKGYA